MVPGLTSADPCVEWRGLYPPYRFAAAAKTMANWKSDLEFQYPSHEITVHSQRMPAKRNGLRMRRVASRLSGLSTLRQAATAPMHLAERTPAVSFLCTSRLLELREQDVCTLTHYGVNFLNDRALRFIDLAPDTWWLFPVFQVSQGEYRWPAEHVNLAETTDLLIGAAVASAYDDVLHGTFPLASDHLPRAVFEDHAEVGALNKVLMDSRLRPRQIPSPRPRARREATDRPTRHRTRLGTRNPTLGCRAHLRPPALVPPPANPLGDP